MSGKMTQFGNNTPTLIEVIKEAIRQNQLELNTMLPAEVVSYDPANQTCVVQPSLKRTNIDPAEVISRPRISDVPVVFPRTSSGGVFFPLSEGDSVMLVFCQRSLDDWIENGGNVQVRDVRLHDLSDAVALAGFYPLSQAINPAQASDATELRGEKILIGKSGTSSEPMVLGEQLNTNLTDLITAIEDLIALITAGQILGTVPTTAVPAGAPCTSTIVTTAVEAALDSVSSALPDQNSDFIFGEKS
jgi:hypothetical protein